MPLFKDLSTNLNKILMQSSKSNLQLEKIIDQRKTSIKNIKDLKLNLKDLKINNDKFNKAVEEFKLSSIEFFKKIEKYLENPTPEKALKVKYQSNVFNDYLTKSTTIFSENKTLSDKAFDSFNKYKNSNSINDIEKSIELKQRLILSLNKNSKITKTFSKLKNQTRKVYYNETSPTPECQKLKATLAAKELEINKVTTELDAFAEKSKLADKYKNAYEESNKKDVQFIEKEDSNLKKISDAMNARNIASFNLSQINITISKKNKIILNSEIPSEVSEQKNLLQALLIIQQDELNKIKTNDLIVGKNTFQSLNLEGQVLRSMEKRLQDNSNDYKEYEKIKKELDSNKEKIQELTSKKENLTTEISALRKTIKNCPH